MKKLILLLNLVLFGSNCFAFDIVYPKKNDVTINAKSTFFIGSSDKPLKINGQDVKLHSSGGFAHVVNLINGKNTFIIQSENKRQIFVITKPEIKAICNLPQQFIKYSKNKYFDVVTENAPLRSTPVNAGINRLAHLQRNILLTIDGEKGGFYRVILGKNFGWIAKSDVKQTPENIIPAELSGYDYVDSEEYFTFIFHLNNKVPFEIVESDPMVLKLYNVKDNPDNTYIMDFPVSEALNGASLSGYSGEYNGNDFIWKIRKPQTINHKKPLKNIKIAIDAGHGGSEIGAIGCLGNKEKDVALDIAKLLETELKKRGAKVFMTREDDNYIGLKDRVDYANKEDAVVFISIHSNALPDGTDPNKISGTSIYYYYNQAKPLAETILNSIVTQTGLNDDKVRQASFAVVRNTNALSILIETAYLINPEDNAKLIDPQFQRVFVQSVADGLESYFSSHHKM